MIKRLILSILVFILLLATVFAEAAKKASPAPQPSAEQQQAFTEQYWQARDAGDEAFNKFVEEVMGKTGPEGDTQVGMLNNLLGGKAADGSEAKGFHGDPSDSGPQDWSDWNIETDANGNVIGFKEKDFEQKDKDGDGEISDEERAQWDEKKKKEHQEAGGAPGEVDNPPDWDQDRDGQPDPGFERDCWQCVMPKEEFSECVDGAPGPCDSHACDQEEECVEHPETHKGKTSICHNCVPKEIIPLWCEAKGFSSDPSCASQCQTIACIPVDVDIKTGKIVPTMQTRERGSTQRCYTCMNIREIEITWVIIIIETPYGRFVLDKGKEGSFKPSSLMALAKVDPATGMIQNTAGNLKNAADFLGSFNVGTGLLGITTTGKIGMDQLSGLLASNLKSGGSFGMNCFDDALKEADSQAVSQGSPTSEDISGKGQERKQNKAQLESETMSEEQMKKADTVGSPAVTGPIVACGNEGRNKVLKVYTATGALVDTITKEMLTLNPDIITEKLGVAQQLTDMLTQRGGIDIAGYVQKFTGLPIKSVQSYAAQAAQMKAKIDQVAAIAAAKKKKKGKEEETAIILPDDPLYQEKGSVKKKKGLLGALGAGEGAAIINPMAASGIPGAERPKNEVDVKDQWGIQEIGYTPWDDPNSAWNVVDANERNIVVAVIDSGLDMTHEDAPQYIWTNPKEIPSNGLDDDQNGFVDDIHGWNFVDENHDFTDIRGHGTFVAGIIAAKYNNGVGIAGINPGAVIMSVKVADEEGGTDSLAIYRGINYAVNHGAKVINVSLGARSISKLEQQAVERAHAMGALVVIASGNSNENLVVFGPSSSKYGLAVGQIDYSGVRSTVSNWGPNLGLVAPGEQIYSLCSKDNKHVVPSVRKFGYYKQNGTSFSTPMVAATASLIWAKNPQLTNQQVTDVLLATAVDMEDKGWDGMTGAGLLNAAAALRSEVDEQMIVMFTNLRVNENALAQIVSIDVYGTVRGRFKEFVIEAGKGKHPGSFKTIAGPFQQQFDYQHITRLKVKDVLRGSKDWILRIKVVDESGGEHIASTPFTLPK
jgi:subtilisin family serine protease